MKISVTGNHVLIALDDEHRKFLGTTQTPYNLTCKGKNPGSQASSFEASASLRKGAPLLSGPMPKSRCLEWLNSNPQFHALWAVAANDGSQRQMLTTTFPLQRLFKLYATRFFMKFTHWIYSALAVCAMGLTACGGGGGDSSTSSSGFAKLQSIQVKADRTSLEAGASVDLHAIGTFSDGTSVDLGDRTANASRALTNITLEGFRFRYRIGNSWSTSNFQSRKCHCHGD